MVKRIVTGLSAYHKVFKKMDLSYPGNCCFRCWCCCYHWLWFTHLILGTNCR